MNRKQAKMLSRLQASRREIADWRTMTAVEKGRIRTAFNLWPKLAYPSYCSITKEVLGRDQVRFSLGRLSA